MNDLQGHSVTAFPVSLQTGGDDSSGDEEGGPKTLEDVVSEMMNNLTAGDDETVRRVSHASRISTASLGLFGSFRKKDMFKDGDTINALRRRNTEYQKKRRSTFKGRNKRPKTHPQTNQDSLVMEAQANQLQSMPNPIVVMEAPSPATNVEKSKKKKKIKPPPSSSSSSALSSSDDDKFAGEDQVDTVVLRRSKSPARSLQVPTTDSMLDPEGLPDRFV